MVATSRLSAAAVVAASFVAALASAGITPVTLAGWTMPTAFPTGTGNVPTGTFYMPPGPNGDGVADQGVLTAGSRLSTTHALAASTYTSPAGNGSTYSFSSNNWSAGDYYEARSSTLGYSDIYLSWDQTRSSTGPSSFLLKMSVDGGANFTTLLAYTVLQSGGGGAPATWSTTTTFAMYRTQLSVADAANRAEVIFRFESVASAASTGSNRIDNVYISSGGAVPGPGALALVGLAGFVGSRRRR